MGAPVRDTFFENLVPHFLQLLTFFLSDVSWNMNFTETLVTKELGPGG